MEKIQRSLYGVFWVVFTAVYFTYFAFQEILPVRNFMNSHLSYLYTLAGVLGVVFLAGDFFSKRNMFRLQGADILVLFFIASVLSVFVNHRYDFTGNIKALMWMAVQVFAFSAFDSDTPKEVHIKRLCRIFDIIIFIWFIGVLWAMKQYLVQFGGYLETIRSDRVQSLHIGFIDGRLFGMFEDPNYAAIVSSFVIGFSVFCLCWAKRPRVFRVYYWISIVLQACYIVLSGSRIGILSILVTGFAGCGFLAAMRSGPAAVKRIAAFILAGLAAAALLLGGYRLAQTGLSYLPAVYEKISAAPKEEVPGEDLPGEDLPPEDSTPSLTPADFTRSDVVNKKDFSNNRFQIWSDYFEVFKTTPIFGASPRGFMLYTKDHFDDLYIIQKQYDVHNGYFRLFVTVGILGGTLMLLWVIYIAFTVIGYLIRQWNARNKDYWMIFLLTLLLLLESFSILTQHGVFFCNLLHDSLFWLMLGFTLYFIRSSAPESNERQSYIGKLFDKIFQRKTASRENHRSQYSADCQRSS